MTAPPQHHWVKWYPSDWRTDPQLRLCSLAARGLWIDLLGFMHDAEPYGYLLFNHEPPTLDEIADLAGVRNVATVRRAMEELERRQVFSRDEAGRIFSRRMVRDEEKRLQDKANGARGGNPILKPPDKPPDKPGVNRRINASVKAHAHPRDRDLEARGQKRSKAEAKATREPAAPFALPPWVPPREWSAFDAMRSAKSGRAWTDDGRCFAINTLTQLRSRGELPSAVLRQSVERAWSGLFALKVDRVSSVRTPTIAEQKAANWQRITGRGRDERTIDGTAERMGSAAVLAIRGDVRQPGDDDVGERGSPDAASGVG